MEKTALGDREHVQIRGGTLTVDLPGKGKTVFEIGTEPIVIGRDESCTIVLAGMKTSKLHAEVIATEQGAELRDLGSTNGTRVNDVLIRDARVLLTRPAKIECGETPLLFAPTRPARLEAHDTEFGPLVGASIAMRQVFARVGKIAATPLSVLIQGETGTGKELVAKAIHDASERAKKKFVVVDCSTVSPSLAESFFFGHERGAFTGAVDKRESPFVEADGGTIFLDEIGELPLEIQQKLLRLLERGELKSVGSAAWRTVSVRVVAATLRDLHKDVNEGRFRADLLFRLADVRVELPPLRKRKDDIPLLAARIAKELSKELGYEPELTFEAIACLQGHDWPGNVRELKKVLRSAFFIARESREPINVADALVQHRGERAIAKQEPANSSATWKEEVASRGRRFFEDLAQLYRGNISKIAAHADVERSTVRRYLEIEGKRKTTKKSSKGGKKK